MIMEKIFQQKVFQNFTRSDFCSIKEALRTYQNTKSEAIPKRSVSNNLKAKFLKSNFLIEDLKQMNLFVREHSNLYKIPLK